MLAQVNMNKAVATNFDDDPVPAARTTVLVVRIRQKKPVRRPQKVYTAEECPPPLRLCPQSRCSARAASTHPANCSMTVYDYSRLRRYSPKQIVRNSMSILTKQGLKQTNYSKYLETLRTEPSGKQPRKTRVVTRVGMTVSIEKELFP